MLRPVIAPRRPPYVGKPSFGVVFSSEEVAALSTKREDDDDDDDEEEVLLLLYDAGSARTVVAPFSVKVKDCNGNLVLPLIVLILPVLVGDDGENDSDVSNTCSKITTGKIILN